MRFARFALSVTALVVLVSCGGAHNAALQGLPQQPNRAVPSAGTGFDSERRWGPLGRDDWEPIVAADPSSSWVYQMTTPQTPNYLMFRSSSDGGATWNPSRRICRRGIKPHFQYDPQVAVDGHSTVDVVCLDNFLPGVVFTAVARSRKKLERTGSARRSSFVQRQADTGRFAVGNRHLRCV